MKGSEQFSTILLTAEQFSKILLTAVRSGQQEGNYE